MHCPHCAIVLETRVDICVGCGVLFPPGFWEELAVVGLSSGDTTTQQISALLDNRYRVDRFIARGGMGEIYHGTDPKLQRDVAIKFLAQEFRDDAMVKSRFLREAQAAASIDHPNVISVYSAGEHEGRPYIVMKYIDGQNVAELIREQGTIELSEAVSIVRQACDGLAVVHARGFVHRDVKPHNLMVDADGHCTILDFGILRFAGSNITTSGALAGTPAYLAPEQAKDSKAADGRSDLYSLGVTFFEMITGKLPFTAASALELVLKHTTESPPSPCELNPRLPPEVESLTRKALAKDPADRYQSATELKEALGRLPGQRDARSGVLSTQAPIRWSGLQRPASAPIRRLAVAEEDVDLDRSELVGAPRRFRTLPVLLLLLVLGGLVAAAVAWLANRPSLTPAKAASGTGANAPARVIAGDAGVAGAERTPTAHEPRQADAGAQPPRPEGLPALLASSPPASRRAPTRRHRRLRRRTPIERPRAAVPPSRSGPRPVAPAGHSVLQVRSEPSGAMVHLGNKRLGETPMTGAMVLPGTYRVTVSKKNYEPWQRTVVFGRGQWRRLDPILRAKPGELHVLTQLDGRGIWARISIDGVAASVTHSVRRRVAPGEHRIVAEREGFVSVRRTVRVLPGERKKVRIALTRLEP